MITFGSMALGELFSAEGHGGMSALKYMGAAAVNLVFAYWGWKGLKSRPLSRAQERYREFAETLKRREGRRP